MSEVEVLPLLSRPSAPHELPRCLAPGTPAPPPELRSARPGPLPPSLGPVRSKFYFSNSRISPEFGNYIPGIYWLAGLCRNSSKDLYQEPSITKNVLIMSQADQDGNMNYTRYVDGPNILEFERFRVG